MSVDTYLRGKDTSAYRVADHGDVTVLIGADMARWSERVRLDARGAWFWRDFDVSVEHEHGPTCAH